MPSTTTMPNSWLLSGAAMMFLLGFIANVIITRTMFNGTLQGRNDMKNMNTAASQNNRGLQEVVQEDKKAEQQVDDGWGTVNIYYGYGVNKQPGKWYGEALQDKEVIEMLGHKRNGYFVDLAACNAGWSSNTLALEHDYDWKGLAMDADHATWQDLSRRKNAHVLGVVVGENDNDLVSFNFKENRIGGSGLIGGNFANKDAEAPGKLMRFSVTLLSAFKKFNVPQTIDYFSLDVEGAEWFIMQHFPFDKYMFRVLTIERPNDDLKELLKKHGYVFVKKLFAEKDGTDFGEEMWAHPTVLEGHLYKMESGKLSYMGKNIDNDITPSLRS